MTQKRAAIAMSGGVDSSAAAVLMQKEGYECIGVTMRLFSGASVSARNNAKDIEDARKVCAKLGMEHVVLDAKEPFERNVIEPFVTSYCAGLTPNPCVNCNKQLKFGILIEWARQQGCICLATGHYARLSAGELRKARDARKDQSYVLYVLTDEQRNFVQLPLGNLLKEEARALAYEQGLVTAQKDESQDICFVPDGNHAHFIEEYLRRLERPVPQSGEILRCTDSGVEVVGTHEGVHRYTIGQRRGLGIAHTEPLYVVSIDADSATITVGEESECHKQIAYLSEVNLLSDIADDDSMVYRAKHRYRGREHAARIRRITASEHDFVCASPDTNADGERDSNACASARGVYQITFLEGQRDLTPGQSLVLYEGDRVIAGGIIQSSATISL